VLAQAAWAADSGTPASQTFILHPTAASLLRIDFDYNFRNALPPFPNEPAFPGKEIARGRIPTFPPTAFLRKISDNELYLSTDHSGDFANGRRATYRSTYDGHVLFQDLHVSSIRDGLEIPYTLVLYTYERGCAGWLNVRSGWTGEVAVAGHRWRLLVADNLDGHIGPEDRLSLRRLPANKGRGMIAITSVPAALAIDGRAFNLSFSFKPGETGAVLEVVFTQTDPPLGTLNLIAPRCTCVCLSNEWGTAVLDATAGASPIPAGTYRITGCFLEEAPGMRRQPTFIRCDRAVTVEPGQATALEIGPPLRNTVQVSRERNLLHLTYQLLGQAGEQYEYYDWKARPRFTVWKGPFRIGGGALPFG